MGVAVTNAQYQERSIYSLARPERTNGLSGAEPEDKKIQKKARVAKTKYPVLYLDFKPEAS